MGICTALLQGGWVRRQKEQEVKLVITGLISCLIGFILLGMFESELLMYMSVFVFSITSATVVTAMTALCSNQSSKMKTGLKLGYFRSYGQLGRAFGPASACGLYWILGPKSLYLGYGGIIGLVTAVFIAVFGRKRLVPHQLKPDHGFKVE